MSNTLPPIKVFAGTRSHYLGEGICKDLGIELGKMNIEPFFKAFGIKEGDKMFRPAAERVIIW